MPRNHTAYTYLSAWRRYLERRDCHSKYNINTTASVCGGNVEHSTHTTVVNG